MNCIPVLRPSTRRFAPAQDEGHLYVASKAYLILSASEASSRRTHGRLSSRFT
jgi:hypothetical protein